MLNNVSRKLLLGAWFATLAVIVAVSVAMDARLSTSMLILLMGLAPVVVMALIGAGAPSPTVAEILHSVNAKDGRA
jgi:hypothetical protein